MTGGFLRNAIRPELIKLRMSATNKEGAIRELLDLLDNTGALANRAEAEKVVFDREAIMSTGMENGVAIPHGKAQSVENLVVAAGLVPDGLDFACADGNLANIIIMTLSPANKTGPHIRFMAEISTLLRSSETRQRLLGAKDVAEVAAILSGSAA